ncbi:MAG: DUF1501 domain-containing protein [Spirochaetes bacterium]|nr:DUF1501 domain-containing protein [Spirochaetota bacterium]
MNASDHNKRLSRREMLRLMATGAAGAALFGSGLFGTEPRKLKNTAKSVIQIWLWGGPTNIDTFDPKPDAGYDYCGPLNKTLQTNVDGIQIGELLPLLAARADKYTLLRGLTHNNNGHETAAYMVQSGWMPGGTLVHPSLGAIVSLKKGYSAGYTNLIPPYIVMTRLQGRFSEAGFLEQRYKPFATGGNPADRRFTVEGIISRDIQPDRQENRRELLTKMNTFGSAMSGVPEVDASKKVQGEAWDLILGSAGKVFDLGQEKQDVRDRYGMNTFGQSCLAARRLVEQGVPYITINFDGWDTHKQHFGIMRTKLPQLDRGIAALLDDLSERGLLDSTIVWCEGEFGRTPRVQWEAPWNGGRNHYGKAFAGLVAGGGFKGGYAIGKTSPTGEDVIERPIYPWDLLASMLDLLGIDPDGTIMHPSGYDVRILPSITEEKLMSGGRLYEIM